MVRSREPSSPKYYAFSMDRRDSTSGPCWHCTQHRERNQNTALWASSHVVGFCALVGRGVLLFISDNLGCSFGLEFAGAARHAKEDVAEPLFWLEDLMFYQPRRIGIKNTWNGVGEGKSVVLPPAVATSSGPPLLKLQRPSLRGSRRRALLSKPTSSWNWPSQDASEPHEKTSATQNSRRTDKQKKNPKQSQQSRTSIQKRSQRKHAATAKSTSQSCFNQPHENYAPVCEPTTSSCSAELHNQV